MIAWGKLSQLNWSIALWLAGRSLVHMQFFKDFCSASPYQAVTNSQIVTLYHPHLGSPTSAYIFLTPWPTSSPNLEYQEQASSGLTTLFGMGVTIRSYCTHAVIARYTWFYGHHYKLHHTCGPSHLTRPHPHAVRRKVIITGNCRLFPYWRELLGVNWSWTWNSDLPFTNT